MVKTRKGGCIINVSSLLALKAVAGTSVYAASKAGLLGKFPHLITAVRSTVCLTHSRANFIPRRRVRPLRHPRQCHCAGVY